MQFISGETAPFCNNTGKVGCVFIHGFTGTPWALEELGNYLAKREITVTAPLLPGHGTKPEDLIGISWKEWVEASRKEFESIRNKCSSVFLLGFSMGGSIALKLASQIEVNGVITLSAPVRLRDPKVYLLPLMRPFKKYWKKKKVSSVQITSEMAYEIYPLAAVSELVKLLRSVRRCLSKVSCPILVVHSGRDDRIPPENADVIYKTVSSNNKRKIILKYPCHVVTKGEDKQRVFEEVFQFIQDWS